MQSRLALCLCAWLLALAVGAQQSPNITLVPANEITANYSGGIEFVFPVQGSENATDIELVPRGPTPLNLSISLSGIVVLANASSQLVINSSSIALISCDPYSGNIQPANVYETAVDNNATAVILYSETLQSCGLNTTLSYDRVYSTPSKAYAQTMISVFNSAGSGLMGSVQPGIPGVNTSPSITGTGSSSSSTPSGTLGPGAIPTPSTEVAMIILYSITGVITALFLTIIITGAVRAHRHPERYGPRNAVGRPRQSRARGLARAMLDTIPIVKFGDRDEDANKPRDVELQGHGRPEILQDQDTEQFQNSENTAHHQQRQSTGQVDEVSAMQAESSSAQDEIGIAPAVGDAQKIEEDNHQGCSICTEDFQMGEDQRVLPCNHRFHPACVDPWLLNVSGTCPLCRIDLRPREGRSSLDEGTETGNGESGGMAPPLADQDDAAGRGASLRRSILRELVGSRPERTTREERVRALRQYREQHANAETQENDVSLGRRLRNAFRIRTRRTGEVDEAQAEPSNTTNP